MDKTPIVIAVIAVGASLYALSRPAHKESPLCTCPPTKQEHPAIDQERHEEVEKILHDSIEHL